MRFEDDGVWYILRYDITIGFLYVQLYTEEFRTLVECERKKTNKKSQKLLDMCTSYILVVCT